ncbi:MULTISPECIES: bacillithiol system redox-active protein YtxJ [Flavobacterium]|uniref:bacillithiol system redox-active protein YtxJ n=1 Tax=Flavobacterium TaxID=237 RepID=UPI00096680C8|nr:MULTISPECIES: bacillithiol system redox-active protein YtxJ [Flavobacterium]MBN9284221.1 bacillithiol system redox-active protein YtxJ [Flavobacterium sp.]OJV70761.1 MAG: thioredoxin family protein [Flavobacterium sp. 40-81]
MSFLDKLFGENKKEEALPKVHWLYLEETPLDEIEKISFEKPVAIFKHSTRCSISRMALKQFENEYDVPATAMELYFLDLLAHRSLSNEVAQRFGVEHQSPQLVLIKNGKAIYDASHSDIDAEVLKQKIA